jgi:F-type H+-transporting ATPase subunit gamma
MPSLQNIKRRIRSVRGIHQITKAQQLVAASKLRRVQQAAVAPQAYTAAARELLARLSSDPVARRNPFFIKRPANNALVIVVAGDRGMAGAYNSNVIRALGRHLGEVQAPMRAICVGKRASMFVAHAKNVDELASYDISGKGLDIMVAQPALQEALDLYLTGEVDVVHMIYTEFVSTVKQQVQVRQLLPVEAPEEASQVSETEPEAEELVDFATRRVLEADLLQAILEARASEEAARMVAMMNATDNAGELMEDLTLAFNNARQANITQELAEISGGAEAITQ